MGLVDNSIDLVICKLIQLIKEFNSLYILSEYDNRQMGWVEEFKDLDFYMLIQLIEKFYSLYILS